MWTAAVVATTSLVVAVLTYLLSTLQAKQQTARETTLRYLNPLRFYVAENLVRLYWIDKDMREHHRYDKLGKVSRAEEVSCQGREWFNEEGYYLATTCYLTARLFSYLADVRREIPYLKLRRRVPYFEFRREIPYFKLRRETSYLKLGKGRDTDLLDRIRSVNVAFAQVAGESGVPYVTQDSIGADMSDGQRKLSYREFCELLRSAERRVWCDRLIRFYRELGEGRHEEQRARVRTSLHELSGFLDYVVGGGVSLKAIVGSEQISWEDFESFLLCR
jgi:hypothetical protein